MIRNIYILLLLSLSFGTVTDIDGNVYETVQIGEQVWMAENLKTTHYNDGSAIPNITNNGDWGGGNGAYGDYDNNPTNSETYGRLYNWNTVDDSRGVCPEGFHVPSDDEYTILTDYLGGNAGGKMKSTGTIEDGDGLWQAPNSGATNESGFTALPAGNRKYTGGYNSLGLITFFWSSSLSGSHNVWNRYLYYNYSNLNRDSVEKNYGYSIRCLADDPNIYGCTDPQACNYDETATGDDGSCEYYDPEIMCDCDETFLDVNGDCCGYLVMDECMVCNGDGPEEHHDCDGNCLVELDCTGNCCVLGEEGCYWQETGPCGEPPGPSNGMDECGVCGGDNSSCMDCAGVPCSDAYIDNCGVCDDDPTNDCVQGCDDIWGSGFELDECGVCDGDGSSCADADSDGCLDSEDDAPYEWDDDYDMDGFPDDCDADDDNDGAADGEDSNDNNEYVCSDVDGDTCDDCSFGMFDPYNDGPDYNENGICDEGDIIDSDGDGVIDDEDSDPYNQYQCADYDGDSCDDCSTGHYNPSDDGWDYDGDGTCDAGDPDDDNDGVVDDNDPEDNNEFVCSDNDGDTCDDCSGGYFDPSNDGDDYDADGLCNLGDMDDDNDGVIDSEDCAPLYELASEFDCAGICGGDNSTYDNCCGIPPNEDCTDVCIMDEMGVCCLVENLDDCGICLGDNSCLCDDPFIYIDGHCLHQDDLAVLQGFIDNSLNSGFVMEDCGDPNDPWCTSPNLYMDQSWHDVIIDGVNYQFSNNNGEVEPLELGLQDWVDGRLTSLMCGAYIYCQLSGDIPGNISDLTEIEVLRLEVNYFSGAIPESICELENINFLDDLAFNLSYNRLCPPYPECVPEGAVQYMDTDECEPECDLGDVNCDGQINVIDIVLTVGLILEDSYDAVGDVNEDGLLNVIDVVMLVNWVLNGTGCSDGSSWDYDMDGICDADDSDDDNDGALDPDDSDDNNEFECSDHDGDTCDDCSTGHYDPSDDGFDYDGDGQCDDGDCDDDNDGCQECWDYCP